ncbi:MAG TPA: dienelactone hydrolase family protein [Allosphingosinicella sp.]|jgi:dienelactone hydrolase|nr:dienelactone hydrolase family protein [Allosphingosinicella sp.]
MTGLVPIAYSGGDGISLTGYLADGSGGRPAPGILVAHEGGGLGRHTRERAARLAGLGYIAFALDYYGEEDPPLDRAMALGKALRADRPLFRSRLQAGLEVLLARADVDRGRLAGLGYCMGGAAVIELARMGAPFAAVVGFHSGFLPGAPAENEAIRGRLLLCHGADDPIVTAVQRDAFLAEATEARIDWQLHLYGGVGHSFTNPDIDALNLPGFAYDEAADRRSWAAMLNLFDEVLEPS